MRGRRTLALITVTLTLLSSYAIVLPARAITGTKGALIALCNFKDQTQKPRPVSYYQNMFGDEGAGQRGAYDYWKDVSYGALSMAATEVKGWYTLDMTRDEWVALGQDRATKWRKCVEAADVDVDLTDFIGVVAVFPNAYSSLASQISATDTTLTVASTSGSGWNFPTPPFNAFLIRGPLGSTCAGVNPGDFGYCEPIKVTKVEGATFTMERAGSGMAGPFQANDGIFVGSDLFGRNPFDDWYPGYKLGAEVMMHDQSLTLALHEQAHLLGFNHSRAVSAWPPVEYNDCYDINSAMTCVYTFLDVLGSTFGGPLGIQKGPGVNSINVDAQGWLPAARKTRFDNSTCRQQTYSMAALNHPEKSGLQQIQIPATGAFPVAGNNEISTEYYSIELRTKTGWDRGIPANAFVLHLKGTDGNPYLLNWNRNEKPVGVNSEGDLQPSGLFENQRNYVDPTAKTYIATNSIDASNFTGVVTVGSCKIDAALSYTGATSGVYHGTVTLSGDMVVAGTSAPVPNAGVIFTLGTQSCGDFTDLAGQASCSITLQQPAGTYTVGAHFQGDDAYDPVTTSKSFTIERAPTTLTYNGPTVILQGSSGVTLSAVLLENGTTPPDPAGQTVTLSLGGQSCTGIVQSTGQVSCTLVFNGPLGNAQLSAVFAGDAYYLPSSDTGKTAIVFAFPSNGAFVLGDQSVAAAGPTTKLSWWSDAWWQVNSLSGGTAPLSFKGFAGTVTLPTTSPANVCPKTFKTLPGNSPPPTAGVPEYMGVLVASSVTKKGTAITGVTGQIVVVKVDPGYSPNPGHPGTGTIVATFCP